MSDIDYSSGPGGFSLTTRAPMAQAASMPGLGQLPGVGGQDFSPMFAMLARRRAQDEARQRAEDQRRQQQFDLQMQLTSDSGNRTAQQADAARDEQRFGFQKEQQLHQLAMQGPPKRMVQGFNIIGGYMPEPTDMNAYQRQMYAPNNAGIASVGSAVPTGSIESPTPGMAEQPAEAAARQAREEREAQQRRNNQFYGRS